MQGTVQPNGSVALEKNTFETYLLHIILEHKPEDHIVWVIGPTEASFLAVLLSTKHFCFVLYVMALPNMSRGY
jgi:hypothetical protein